MPRKYCYWNHRFDDPKREYRTLYCAKSRVTCLRETLADFRLNAQAVAEYKQLFGELPTPGIVPRWWLKRQALVAGRIEIRGGELVSVDEPRRRRLFEREHAELLVAHGIEHLNISEVRSRNRVVTQQLSRFMFERGAAGVLYGSDVDNEPCVALFEDRAVVVPVGGPSRPLVEERPVELGQVCEEFDLVLSEE